MVHTHWVYMPTTIVIKRNVGPVIIGVSTICVEIKLQNQTCDNFVKIKIISDFKENMDMHP